MSIIDGLHAAMTRLSRRAGGALSCAEADAITRRWCEKHRYNYARAVGNLFGGYMDAWLSCDGLSGAGTWLVQLLPEVDLACSEPTSICRWCERGEWHSGRSFRFHCDRRICRALDRFVFHTPARTAKFRGPNFPILVLAEFVKRMAKPTAAADYEFSKRFPHRRAA